MGRILAVDYGRKRCGIAATDTLQLIANGLTTVATAELMTFLENYMRKEPVDAVVIGLPKQNDNSDSESARYIEPFVRNLQKKFPALRVERYDERFTSKLAFRTMIDSGLKKKDRQNKALVDQISATIILQSYLESKKYNGI